MSDRAIHLVLLDLADTSRASDHHGVVTPTVIEIVPSRVAPALQGLLEP